MIYPTQFKPIFIYFRDHCNEGCCTPVDSACLKFEMPRHSFERFGDPSPRLWRGKWSAGITRVFSACAVAVLKASISCSPHPQLISGNKVHLLPSRSFNREHIILEKWTRRSSDNVRNRLYMIITMYHLT